MDGVYMLIVSNSTPVYYMFPKVTDQEYRYLNMLEGTHVENVHYSYKKNEEHKKLYEALCYVEAAIGYTDKEMLESLELSNTKECIEILGKWREHRVDTLAEINEKYRGHIDAVFCINNNHV